MKILFFSHGKRANGGAERCLLDLVSCLKQARESGNLCSLRQKTNCEMT